MPTNQDFYASDRPRRRRAGNLCGALLLGLALGFGATASSAGEPLRIIALSDQQAPGAAPNVTFLRFNSLPIAKPPVDLSGNPTFFAQLQGPGVVSGRNTGVWAELNGDLSSLALAGDPAPGTGPGVVFLNFALVELPTRPTIGGGRAVFQGVLTGPGVGGTNAAGLWTSDGIATELLVRQGDPAPDQSPGITTQSLLFRGLTIGSGLTAGGSALFTAVLVGPGLHPDNNEVLYAERSGGLRALLQEGDSLPGSPPGAVVGLEAGGGSTSFGLIDAAPSGELALALFLQGPGIDAGNNEAIVVETAGGTFSIVCQEGTPVPDRPGEFFGDLGRAGFRSIASWAPGAVAFTAFVQEVSGTDQGVFTNRGGSLSTIALTGEPAPGSGSQFFIFGTIAAGSTGEILFRATLLDSPGAGGLWQTSGSELLPVAIPGDSLPGLPGLTFLGSGTLHGWADDGLVAFDASLEEPGGTFRSGVLVGSAESGFELAAELGADLDLAGDGSDVRTVSAIEAEHFSAAGDLYFELRFTDGSSGIFVRRFQRAIFQDGFESGDTTKWGAVRGR